MVEYETMHEGKYYCRSGTCSSRMMFKMMSITSFNNTQLSILIHGIVRFKTYVLQFEKIKYLLTDQICIRDQHSMTLKNKM